MAMAMATSAARPPRLLRTYQQTQGIAAAACFVPSRPLILASGARRRVNLGALRDVAMQAAESPVADLFGGQ